MYTLTLASAMFFQDTSTEETNHLIMIFIGIAAFALLAQACVLLAMAIGASKAQKAVLGHVESINAKLLPLLDKSNGLVTELSPKINVIVGHATAIAGNVEEISTLVREKAQEFAPTITAAKETIDEANSTVQDANRKTQAQVDRVNGMVSSVLDATAQVGRSIHKGITTPVREVSGIFEGLKAGILTFINGSRR